MLIDFSRSNIIIPMQRNVKKSVSKPLLMIIEALFLEYYPLQYFDVLSKLFLQVSDSYYRDLDLMCFVFQIYRHAAMSVHLLFLRTACVFNIPL